MHEHNSAGVNRVVDEATSDGKVDEEVGIVHVLDADAQVADARRRVVCRDRLRTNRDNVRNASVRECPGRNGSVNPAK